MQNEHGMKFQYFHPLIDESIMRSWLKLIRQASPEVLYLPESICFANWKAIHFLNSSIGFSAPQMSPENLLLLELYLMRRVEKMM